MRRALALILLILALAPGTWVREAPPRQPSRFALAIEALPLPPKALLDTHLGAFRLEGIWQLDSPNAEFGGFSAMVAPGEGRLLALSDKGFRLAFSPPGAESRIEPVLRPMLTARAAGKAHRDIEAATLDPASRRLWIALENSNSIIRYRIAGDGEPVLSKRVEPPGMADWGANSGPETLVRLSDGRFLVLREGFTGPRERERHQALLFASDPTENPEAMKFTMIGPRGFSPTDGAQLPDGRVLVLMRRVVWPFPARFAGRLAIGDPAQIGTGKTWRVTEVARLAPSLPVDNFEGMAIEPRTDGTVTIWLISDDNDAAFQRTLLWKLALDPADLARPSK